MNFTFNDIDSGEHLFPDTADNVFIVDMTKSCRLALDSMNIG